MAADYRPLSSIINQCNEGEVSRPGGYPPNQPMSLDLEHKRVNSRSLQKPKKGILKQSSSYLGEGQSSHKKQGMVCINNAPLSPNGAHVQSPYLAMNKSKKQVLRTAHTLPERASITGLGSAKKNSMRTDLSKKIISKLGGGDDPPKFTHASTMKSNNFFNSKLSNNDLRGHLDDQQNSRNNNYGGKKKS